MTAEEEAALRSLLDDASQAGKTADEIHEETIRALMKEAQETSPGANPDSPYYDPVALGKAARDISELTAHILDDWPKAIAAIDKTFSRAILNKKPDDIEKMKSVQAALSNMYYNILPEYELLAKFYGLSYLYDEIEVSRMILSQGMSKIKNYMHSLYAPSEFAPGKN